MSKRLCKTTAQLIRDVLFEKVEFYEEKFRLEDERKRGEREGRAPRTLTTLQDRIAERKQQAEQKKEAERERRETPTSTPPPAPPPQDRFEKLYEEQARIILTAPASSTLERRLKVAEALAAVKREAPLTAPKDVDILLGIERALLRLQAAQATAVTPATPEESSLAIVARALERVANAITSSDPKKNEV